MRYEFEGKLWKYSGEAAWHFVTIPAEYTLEIKAAQNPISKNFGSVRVKATIGSTTWDTSIFPDNKSESFLLPIKKEIRNINKLTENQIIDVCIEIYTGKI